MFWHRGGFRRLDCVCYTIQADNKLTVADGMMGFIHNCVVEYERNTVSVAHTDGSHDTKGWKVFPYSTTKMWVKSMFRQSKRIHFRIKVGPSLYRDAITGQLWFHIYQWKPLCDHCNDHNSCPIFLRFPRLTIQIAFHWQSLLKIVLHSALRTARTRKTPWP